MKLIKLLLGLFIFSLTLVNPVKLQAQISSNPAGLAEILETATEAAEASKSAEDIEASMSSIVKRVVEKEPDITQPEPEIKGKLEKYLEDNPLGSINVFNFIRHAIRNAVSQGVPANTLVLILMFPLIATIVVIARHIIGMKSFGIFTPALLAVAFLNTGLVTGSALFILLLFVATFMRMLLRRMRIQYLPRMATFMLFVSLAVFVTLLVSPSLGQEELITIGIFPILILVLLLEDFLDVQITRNLPEALEVTIETLILAIICNLVMDMEILQKFALLNPEMFILLILAVIAIVERYSGMRLMEVWRFRKLLQ